MFKYNYFIIAFVSKNVDFLFRGFGMALNATPAFRCFIQLLIIGRSIAPVDIFFVVMKRVRSSVF